MTPDEVRALFADNPTRQQLETRLGISEDAVKKMLARLRAKGYKIVSVWSGQYRYEILKG